MNPQEHSAPESVLYDRFGRVHDYLRISLVDKCNLRCTYCMPENIRFLPQAQLMQAEELFEIAKTFVSLGVKKIRLTGGEPLLRKDASEIIRKLGTLGVELAITTNGILLDSFLDDFAAVGMRSLNISLDTLDPAQFMAITRRDLFAKVFENIQLALQMGFRVKLNMVVMKGVNTNEIADFVALGKENDLHLRFIEFMPFDGNQWENDKVFGHAEILAAVQERFEFEKLEDKKHSTSRAYKVNGFKGTFAIISTVTKPFCEACNRLRLTAEGKMRNCLFAKGEMDLLSALREGKQLIPLIRENLAQKAEKLGGLPAFENKDELQKQMSERAMVKIGG